MPIFRHHLSSIVTVGTFNIYILQPHTLRAMGVIETEHPTPVLGDLTSPGIRFEVDEMKWTVRPDRLAVETASDKDCGAMVAQVLEKLSWTPVAAMGVNTVFRGNATDKVTGKLVLPCVDEAIQCSAHAAFDFDSEGTLNVQLSKTQEHQEVALNLHFELKYLRHQPAELSRKVVQYCHDYKSLIEKAKTFATTLTGIEFENAEPL